MIAWWHIEIINLKKCDPLLKQRNRYHKHHCKGTLVDSSVGWNTVGVQLSITNIDASSLLALCE